MNSGHLTDADNEGSFMKVLIVEDDKIISDFVAKGLVEAGFTVDQAFNGEVGLDLAMEGSYDALIVDLMLPELDGLSVISSLRHNRVSTPVLILSAKHTVDDRIKGLETGGDDYLVKPFSFGELLARINALTRRSFNVIDTSCIEYSDLSIDLLKRQVVRAGQIIELQPREFSLLEYLVQNAERVLSKTMILERVWDYNFDPQTNVVDVLVSRLRGKIDRDYPEKLIHTVWGVGYVFKKRL